MGSPYSPLRVERDIPSRNWRDAFEDLLAIDLGGQMIGHEHRKAEDETAAKIRYDTASEAITLTNEGVQDLLKRENKWLSWRNKCEANGDRDLVMKIDAALQDLRSSREGLASEGADAKTEYEKNATASASSLKPRGQWIASLITSGALPGWESSMSNSLDGPVMFFSRHDAPPELQAGIATSELEMHEVFEDKQPHRIDSPQQIPSDRIRALAHPSRFQARVHASSYLQKIWPSPLSVLYQTARTEPANKAHGASGGFKVVVQNYLINGKVDTKEFVQQPGKLLEEVEKVRSSMAHLRLLEMELGTDMWIEESPSHTDHSLDSELIGS
ncbi:MAG: hypothetical protein L6R40_008492 [Gallowayella cf. fulva]|nr:MAG: hypothetical protein L6R40_008492 [Xanthomendoza cf. fulva]